MHLLVSLVGMAGSGKSSIAVMFETKKFTKIRFGDLTEEELKKKNLKVTPENERKIRIELRKNLGMNIYAKHKKKEIEKELKKNNVIIDGLYAWEEYVYLKKYFPNMITVHIYSPPEIRYARLEKRDERKFNILQAKERDKNEIVSLNKGGPIAMANYVLTNNSSLTELENNFNILFEKLKIE